MNPSPERQGEPRLSHAGKQALDALEQEFRDEILEAANSRRAGFSTREELTTLDILRAAEQLRDRTSARERRIERLSLAYAGVGASVAVASTLLFLLLAVGNTGSLGQLIVAVVGIAAALVGLLGGYVVLLRARRVEFGFDPEGLRAWGEISQSPSERATGVFMNQWSELELLLRAAVVRSVGESQGAAPISKQFALLQANAVLESEDVETLRRSLDLRNQVAHGRGDQIDTADLAMAVKDMARLNEKLRGKLGQPQVRP